MFVIVRCVESEIPQTSSKVLKGQPYRYTTQCVYSISQDSLVCLRVKDLSLIDIYMLFGLG